MKVDPYCLFKFIILSYICLTGLLDVLNSENTETNGCSSVLLFPHYLRISTFSINNLKFIEINPVSLLLQSLVKCMMKI